MGKRKGAPNLKRENGAIINKHGVRITEAEKRELKSLATIANRNRKKIIAETDNLPRTFAGKQLGDTTLADMRKMGVESDFYVAKKHTRLHQFETRKSFDTYIQNLRRVTSPNYLDDRARLYKRNYIEALQELYGKEQTKGIAMKIRTMPPQAYSKMVMSEEMAEIEYLYYNSAEEAEAKFNTILSQLSKTIDKFNREYRAEQKKPKKTKKTKKPRKKR